MIDFQTAVAKLLWPATSHPKSASSLAIMQAGFSANGLPDRAISFKELENLISQAQATFRKFGVHTNDYVLFVSPNSPELVAAILATWRLGAVAVPVDFRLTKKEVENIATRINAKIVFSPEPIFDGLTVVTPNDWSQTLAEFTPPNLDKLSPNNLSLLILTSGTTGVPKGAIHDLGSLMNNVSELGGQFGLTKEHRAFLPLPVSHIFGIEMMLAGLLFQAPTIFSDFSPTNFWDCIQRHNATLVVGVPTIYGALLNLPAPTLKNNPVRFYLSGGAPLPVSLAQEFETRFGRRIIQGYGTTETKILSFNADGPIASVGRALPSVKFEIVDPQDNVLPQGESGEICVAGPTLMLGYLNQPEATSTVLHQGHYHTGDIGYLSNDYLFISGRSKEMIIVAGNKVFPQEVESVIRQHPLVDEVAVIGIPHQKLGQLVKAVVVVKACELSNLLSRENNASEAVKELKAKFRSFCQEHLKRELRPMDWEFRPISMPLPKTHTGKIDKKQLQI